MGVKLGQLQTSPKHPAWSRPKLSLSSLAWRQAATSPPLAAAARVQRLNTKRKTAGCSAWTQREKQLLLICSKTLFLTESSALHCAREFNTGNHDCSQQAILLALSIAFMPKLLWGHLAAAATGRCLVAASLSPDLDLPLKSTAHCSILQAVAGEGEAVAGEGSLAWIG